MLNFAWWNHDIRNPGLQLLRRYPREFQLDLWRRSEAYARLLYAGRRTAAGRMAARCAALGGDGVVRVRIEVSPYPGDKRALQFTAAGTAVRAEGGIHMAAPFLACTPAQDFARLIAAGWVPAGIAVGVSCTWRGWSAGTAPRCWDDGNRELERWTEAVTLARAGARDQMQADAARTGGDGVVLAGMDMRTSVHHHMGPWRGAGGYCIVEVTATGTAITAFRPPARPGNPPSPVINLNASS